MSKLEQKLENLPMTPGVYVYFNSDKKVIYVGKAKNLRARVSSYFLPVSKGPKTDALVSKITDLDIIQVNSEVEAFLLEAELIKRYKPRYNVMLKDDKAYKYITIANYKIDYEGKKYDYSRIETERQKKSKKSIEYYGPYPDGGTVNKAIRAFRRIFPFCELSPRQLKLSLVKGRGCLQSHIGLCPGPCISLEELPKHQLSISRIRMFLKRGYQATIEELTKMMQQYAGKEEFEEAQKIKLLLDKVFALSNVSIMPSQYIDNPSFIYDIKARRLNDIQEIFHIEKVDRIECYDISNIMGEWATASMVVSESGQISKSQYRKFRIKYTKGITDYGMMKEVLTRRSKREWPLPHLLLIDGGKGQVNIVLKAIERTSLEFTPVVGIFKPNDYFVTKINDSWRQIRVDKTNLGFQHLRELRDEAHRFAKKYHTLLRSSINKK